MTSQWITCSRRGFLIGGALLALGARTSVASQTPVGDAFDAFVDRLLPLLSMVLPITPDPGNLAPLFYYTDLAGQLASVGIDQPRPGSAPNALPVGFAEAMLGLPLAAHAFQREVGDNWFETFGFEPYAVHRVLTLNAASGVISVFAGGLDTDRIAESLSDVGYEEHERASRAFVWSFAGESDTTLPVFRLGLGTMDHAAIFDDAVVFAQDRTAIEAVTRVSTGDEPSMAEASVWPALLPTFSDDLVGFIPILPASMHVPLSDVGATPVATPTFGGLRHLAFGIRAGAMSEPLSLVGEGTPEATPVSGFEPQPSRIEVRLRYESEEQAARHVELIPELWALGTSAFSGQPLTSLMTVESAAVSKMVPTVASIDFTTASATNAWIQLVQARDLAPFFPAEG